MGNFINLPYSLAMIHQQYQCYLSMNTCDVFGWSDSIEVGRGNCLVENLYWCVTMLTMDMMQCIFLITGSVVSSDRLKDQLDIPVSSTFR